MSRRPRLKDVAALAGVTTSTASRALNRPEMVRPATRERVEAAASELGYTPNGAARSLITGRTRIIALMVPDLANVYFALIGREVQTRARDRGYDVLILDTGFDPELERDLVESMSRWVDGIIICAAQRSHAPAPNGAPIVYVNRRVRGSHAVLLDQPQVVDAQLDHLVGLGHRRILAATGPKSYWASALRHRRALRWSTRVDVRVAPPAPPDFPGGLAIARDLDADVTAVAAFNDKQAFGVIQGLRARGLRVPDDVSVIGSDDIPSAEFVTPRLTTVRVPKAAMGHAAVSLLLDHLTTEGPVIVETLSADLVVRDSTAPPPQA